MWQGFLEVKLTTLHFVHMQHRVCFFYKIWGCRWEVVIPLTFKESTAIDLISQWHTITAIKNLGQLSDPKTHIWHSLAQLMLSYTNHNLAALRGDCICCSVFWW
jgi:hypothetical protein